MSNKKVSYSAVVLDKESQDKIMNQIGKYIPSDWKIINHHSTINLGELKPEFGYNVGDVVEMISGEIGVSDKAIALKTDIRTNNKTPHITVAINDKNGAKPKDSNDIVNWNKLSNPIILSGVVEEVLY